MSGPAPWHTRDSNLFTFARNVTTRYALLLVNVVIGLLVLPFNLRHLGESAYGLWIVIATLTAYFSVLELGYGGAVVKYVAEYRARKDAQGLNTVLSTMFYVLSGIGVAVYAVAITVSFLLPHIFNLDAEEAATGQIVLLIIAVNLALHFVFSVYGGVINGFERYYLNNVVGTVSTIAVACVNVLVLWLGFGLIELVAATTITRIVPYFVYRRNAYKVFPELRISREFFRRDILRELTGFSAYLAVIDWSTRITYAIDIFILGMFLNTAVVAVYTVAQRLADGLHRMTNQLHTLLFPAVVYQTVAGGAKEQRDLMVKATRFQLAIAVALCGSMAAMSDALIGAWVGKELDDPASVAGSAAVLRVLAAVVVLRTLIAMPVTMLKGTGHHRFVARASAWCALASLLLSIAGVKLFGMYGVAWATLIASVALAAGAIFPRTCHVVGLSTWQGYRQVVWPATWPAIVVIAGLAASRQAVPANIVAILAHLAFGGMVYAALFVLWGLDREERRWFTAAVFQVWRRGSREFATAYGGAR